MENDFFFNYSENGGGAVYAHSTQPEIYYAFSFLSDKNKFYFNSTNGSGGAIFTRQSIINFHDNMICKNIANTGGGICCESLFTAETANNFIYANEANLSGGGLYLNDCQYYLPIRISDNVFRGNTYTNKGGGACIENCKHVNMDRNLFVSNTGPFTTSQGNGSYINNSSTDIFNSIYHMNVSASTYGALSIGGLQTQDTINITNCNFSSNDETGGIVVNVPISESQLNIMNNIFWGNSYRSIINPYNSAKLYPNYCWTNEFNLGNVEFLNSIIGTVPGWVSNVNFNLKQNSACIDGGNPQNIYNDFYFPPAYLNGPSWGTETNDIGATGGPKAANDSASILYHIPQIIGAEVAFTYSVIDPTENIVEFTDNSQVEPNFENHARWVFGDGESYGYLYTTTPPVSFTHNYDNDLTQVKVTLIIETPNDIVKTSQTVDLSNSTEPVLKGVTTQKFVAFKTTEADKILENSNDKIPAIDITIFPNPSSGAFTILLGTISIVAPPKITIYNAFGNLVTTIQKSEIINNEVYVNLANCPPGIYLVKIDSSGKSIFKKVLIQNSNN
nr:T9SS type A sorting domain-containing protein [Bacteroidota bacterium]